MRATSAGRWSGAPRSLLPGPIDTKKNVRPDISIAVSAAPSSTLSRPSSAQKLRPGSRLNVMDSSNGGRPTTPTNIGRPTTPTNIGRPTTPTAVRSTTPTSTSRSLSASRTRPAVHQLFTVASPQLQGTIPIDQRSKFSVSRSTSTPSKEAMSPNGVGTPTRSRTPTKVPNSAGGAAREIKVGPYGFMLRELKREKNMFVKDDTKERDLKTLMNQLQLLKLQLKKKFEADRLQEERYLLQSWQLVYDAEEEAFGLRSKEKIALEINKIHAQLVDMDNRVDQVNNFIAPVFEKLNSYVNLRMHQSEEEKSNTLVRSITAKASINREYSTAFLKLDKSIRVLERMLEKRDRLTGPVKTPEAKRSSSFTFEMPVLTPVKEEQKIKKTISSNTFEVPALVHVENFADDSVAMPGTIKESSKPSRRPSRENMMGSGGSASKLGLKPGSASTGSPSVPSAVAAVSAVPVTAAPAAVMSTPVRSTLPDDHAGHTLTPKSSSENLKKSFMRATQSTTHHVEETREAHHHQSLTPKGSMENVKKDLSPKTSKDKEAMQHQTLSSKASSENLKKELSPKQSMDNVKKGGLTPKPSMENLTVYKKDSGERSPKMASTAVGGAGVDNNKSFRRINSNGSMTGIQRPSSTNALLKKNSNPTMTGSKKTSTTPVTPNNKAALELGDIQIVDDDVNVDDDEEMVSSIPAPVVIPQKEAPVVKERPRSANSISYARATPPEVASSVPEGRHSINLSEVSNLKGLTSGGGFDDFASKLASLESGYYQIPEFKPKTKRSKSIDRSTTPTSGSSTPSIMKNIEGNNKASLSNGAAISDLTTGSEAPAAGEEAAPVPAVSSRSPAKSAVAAALSIDSTADLIPLNNSSSTSPSRATPDAVPSPKKNGAPAAEGFPTEKMDLAAKIAALESKNTASAKTEETTAAPSTVQKSYADFMAKNKTSTSVEGSTAAAGPAASVPVVAPAVSEPVVAALPAVPAAAAAPQSSVKQSYADFLAKNKTNNTSTLKIETTDAAPAAANAVVEEKPVVVAPVAAAAATPAPAAGAVAPVVSSGSAYSNFMKKFKSEKASPITVLETPKTEEPVSIVATPPASSSSVVEVEPSPVSPNPNLATFSVDSSAPTPPRNAYANFLSKSKPPSSLSINNTSSNTVGQTETASAVEAVPLSIVTSAPTAAAPSASATEIPTPSRSAYADFMAKKNSTTAPTAADSSFSLDTLPPPAARPPVGPGTVPATTAALPPVAPAPLAPITAPAPSPLGAKSAYGAFLSKNKSNATSFYSKSDSPAVASSSAYIDVPATSIAASVVVNDEPPPSVYTAHRMSLKRQEQAPDVVREELVVGKSPSSDKLSTLGGTENQPVAVPQPGKNAYADFLKKRPSITAPANTSASHLDENGSEAGSSVAPSPKSPSDAGSVTTPVPVVVAATAAPAPTATATAAGAPGSAYAAFLKRNTSGTAPAPQVSYTAVAATEEPVVDIAALRASAEASSAAPTAVDPSKSSLTIEVSEKPPRPMSTRTAYADFLSKKKSAYANDGSSSNVDDETTRDGVGSGGVSTSGSPASVSSTSSAPLAAAAPTAAASAAATAGEAPSSSAKMSYQDFIKKKQDPTSPKKGPSVDYGAAAATFEEPAPASEGVAVLKPGEFTAYGEILAKFKKTESEVMKPDSPSSKSNKSSPKSAAQPATAAAPPTSQPLPPPVQQQQQSVLTADPTDDTPPPAIEHTVSQDYYGSKNNTPEKSDTTTPVTPGVGFSDDFEPRVGIETYDSFDEHDQQFNKPIDWESGKGGVASGRDKSHSIDSTSKVQGLPPLQPSASKPKGLSRFMSFTLSSPSPKKPPSDSGSVDGQVMSPSTGSSQGSVDENGEPKKKKRNPIHFLQKNVFGRQSSAKT